MAVPTEEYPIFCTRISCSGRWSPGYVERFHDGEVAHLEYSHKRLVEVTNGWNEARLHSLKDMRDDSED